MKKICISIFLGIFLAGLLAAQSDLQPAAIVRLTKSEPITVKQYRTELERYEKQAGRALAATEKRQVLDMMINERLAMQAAERDKIAITDNDVNQQLTQLKNNMAQSVGRQPTDTEFGQAIRNETGLELPAFREQLKKQLLIQKYLMEKKKDSFANIKVPSEDEIKNAYNLAKAQMVRPETVRFSMIQVAFTDAASKAKAKDIADRLAREIGTNPSKFDENLIKSQTPSADFKAGDGGYLPRNTQAQQVVGPDFMNIAFTLKQGEVSRVIEGAKGYQIIKITETYEQKNLELEDIFQLGTRMTVRDYIGNSLLQEREQSIIAKATQELVTELRTGNPYQIIEANINF
ncbi:peptidyl-prolyl cis-trans isomerase [Leadbettera azotonutricia]|uniref:Putative basic membrane protein n=1 Tax=Leadbettera azotonutricia (strain ATCC BAA-888 / DSM 13862 / ZAS-9) TaxID=545695 RepID=F5Y7S0_LEAAZ|nr:peptidyl-prolyl cis-trans isomerase [Leadbettera azotonutricia]AEF80636.1 putative basic membrane protein [Leadbettera azotonutricia ZAS-9]